MHDKRAFKRHQVCIQGKLLSPDLSFCVDCVVKDISEGGAQVSVGSSGLVPSRVYLWQSKTGTFFEADVRWRKPNLLGLHFIDVASRAQSRALIERYGVAQPVQHTHFAGLASQSRVAQLAAEPGLPSALAARAACVVAPHR